MYTTALTETHQYNLLKNVVIWRSSVVVQKRTEQLYLCLIYQHTTTFLQVLNLSFRWEKRFQNRCATTHRVWLLALGNVSSIRWCCDARAEKLPNRSRLIEYRSTSLAESSASVTSTELTRRACEFASRLDQNNLNDIHATANHLKAALQHLPQATCNKQQNPITTALQLATNCC
jgi:hypothetical protein